MPTTIPDLKVEVVSQPPLTIPPINIPPVQYKYEVFRQGSRIGTLTTSVPVALQEHIDAGTLGVFQILKIIHSMPPGSSTRIDV